MDSWLASSWVYWVVSIGLGMLGLIGVLWGWLGDRWRYGTKTPRCRKCRYDMTSAQAAGGKYKCPECGHEHVSERLLHKPPRWWRRVVAGGLLVCSSGYLLATPSIHLRMSKEFDEPWYIAAIPNTLRIAIWPYVGDDLRRGFQVQWAPNIINFAGPRFPLLDWQARWLMTQLANDSESNDAERRFRGLACAGTMSLYYPAIADAATELLRKGLYDPDVKVRNTAVHWFYLGSAEILSTDVPGVLEIALSDSNADSRRWAVHLLEKGARRIELIRTDSIWEKAADLVYDTEVTFETVRLLWTIDRDKAAVLAPKLLHHPDERVIAQTLTALSLYPESWEIFVTYYEDCPIDMEETVFRMMMGLDPDRCRAYVLKLGTNESPELKAKAHRAAEHLAAIDAESKPSRSEK